MELIDRTTLLKEIENNENKPKNNNKADLVDWILECIKNAPVISDTNTDAKADIQAGQYVYVIVKDRWTKVSEILKCYVLKKIIKPNQIPKYRICSHHANGDYYESTITEKAIGITMFTGSEEAKETLKLGSNFIADIAKIAEKVHRMRKNDKLNFKSAEEVYHWLEEQVLSGKDMTVYCKYSTM